MYRVTAEGAVIDEPGLFDKVWPPVISGVCVGFIVFLLTRLYDAFQFEKKLTDLTARLVSKEELKAELSEFKANHLQPIKERQSKFDATLQDLQKVTTDTREVVIQIASKLDVAIRVSK